MESETGWRRVSRRRPCAICGKPDWCGVSKDGSVAICMRVRSDRPTRNGGWLHRLADLEAKPPLREYVPRPRRRRQGRDWDAILTWWAKDTTGGRVAQLGRTLGVSAASLRRLGVRWAARCRAWAFPMADAAGRTIGIRLRADDGRKWAVRGSRNGLFRPERLGEASKAPLLICEGPTDTAALLDLGYDAIGRPSCTGAVEMVVDVVRRLKRAEVVVVADADGPGIDGAEHLARELTLAGRRPRVIRPLAGKDARAWLAAGATRAVVDTVIANAMHWRD